MILSSVWRSTQAILSVNVVRYAVRLLRVYVLLSHQCGDFDFFFFCIINSYYYPFTAGMLYESALATQIFRGMFLH